MGSFLDKNYKNTIAGICTENNTTKDQIITTYKLLLSNSISGCGRCAGGASLKKF